MSVPICQHIRLNGTRCNAIALRQQDLCHYHHGVAERHNPLNPPITQEFLDHVGSDTESIRHPYLAEYHGYKPKHPVMLNLPVLEDSTSILCATSMLVTALGEYRIPPKLATPILYGLQIALVALRSGQPPVAAAPKNTSEPVTHPPAIPV